VNESIRTKLLLSFALLALAPLAFLSVLSYHLAARSVEKGQYEVLTSLAREKQFQLATFTEHNLQWLDAVARQHALREKFKLWRDAGSDKATVSNELTASLREWIGTVPDLEGASLLDGKGVVVASTDAVGKDRRCARGRRKTLRPGPLSLASYRQAGADAGRDASRRRSPGGSPCVSLERQGSAGGRRRGRSARRNR
jgi:hypothetical protein